MHGQFIWYELTTPDVDAAKKFYPQFTGWGTQPFDKDYSMWTTGGVPVGGIFRLNDQMRQQGVPPNWMPYIEAANVDDTAKKATSLGGKVTVPPTDIPNVGRFAVVQDPQGAMFGVYKSNGPSGAWDGKAVVGRFSWHELMTTDYAKAFEFYRGVFGWEQTGEPMDMGGGNKYFMYGQGGAMYGGIYNTMPDMAGMPPFWLVYIHVKDVGKAVTTATKAGAKVVRPQMDIPGGTIAILADPQGAGFALHDMKAPAAAKPAATAKPAAKKPAKSAAKKVAKAAKSGARKVAKAAKSAVKKVAKAAKSVARKVAKKSAAVKSPKAKPKAKAASKAKGSVKAKARPKAKAKAKARKR